MTQINLDEQRQWYEDWHRRHPDELPVEQLKQQMRLESIEQALTQVSQQDILVIGCGSGDELLLLNGERVVAFDLSVNAVRNAQAIEPRSHYAQADGMHLPFGDQQFDLVLSSEVIEHMLEPDKMIDEIVRVLKPGGNLIITTPNWRSWFGLARKVGEFVLRRPVTSDGQPVDEWQTVGSLSHLLEKDNQLKVVAKRGAWYFPPTGLGHTRLPDRFMASIFQRLLGIERWLQRALPSWGHLLVVVAKRPAESS